jgi:hypothetical protein
LFDCDDPDCATSFECSTESDCGNGQDDDQDGAIDCVDWDCSSSAACAGQVEICDNGVDDAGDGFNGIDCDDQYCCLSPACSGTAACNLEAICDDYEMDSQGNPVLDAQGNQIPYDNDNDGLANCEDPDCTGDPACAPENCFDPTADENNNGDLGCDDATCASEPFCSTSFQGFWLDYIEPTLSNLGCTGCHNGMLNTYSSLMSGYAGSYNGSNSGATGGTHNTGYPGNVMPWIDVTGTLPQNGGTGSSSTSYLYLKMMGTHGAVGGGGSQMPLSGATPVPEELQLIKDWIEFGAPEFGN